MLPQIMYLYTFIFVLYIFLSYNQFMDFKEHLYHSLPKEEVDQLIDSFKNLKGILKVDIIGVE